MYHRLDISNNRSLWIVFQASEGMKAGINDFLSSAAPTDLISTDSLSIHLFFFIELARKWREYIVFLEVQVSEKVV